MKPIFSDDEATKKLVNAKSRVYSIVGNKDMELLFSDCFAMDLFFNMVVPILSTTIFWNPHMLTSMFTSIAGKIFCFFFGSWMMWNNMATTHDLSHREPFGWFSNMVVCWYHPFTLYPASRYKLVHHYHHVCFLGPKDYEIAKLQESDFGTTFWSRVIHFLSSPLYAYKSMFFHPVPVNAIYEYWWDVMDILVVSVNWFIISKVSPNFSEFCVWVFLWSLGNFLFLSVEIALEHLALDRTKDVSFGPFHTPSFFLRVLFWAGPMGTGHSLHHIFPNAPNYNIHRYGYGIIERVYKAEGLVEYCNHTGLLHIFYHYFFAPSIDVCTAW